MTASAPAPAHSVHGMGTEPVAADWPAPTLAECDDLLRGYPGPGGAQRVDWLSPRPLSAAALVRTKRGGHSGFGGEAGAVGEVFVKRHHSSVRTAAGLMEEHRFLAHLRSRGAAVVDVLEDAEGRTAVERGQWTYEVHSVGKGEDLYREAISWSPFTDVRHAEAAGRAMALLHQAAAGFAAPPRAPQPLVAGFSVAQEADLVESVRRYAAGRPAVGAYLASQPWEEELERWHLPFHRRLLPVLADLPPLWTHNDFHASNLLWSGGRVATVLDFGLADRAFAVHDLAVAIERNAIEWLELPDKGAAAVHFDSVTALIDGYQQVRSLTQAERQALPDLLALCQVDFALSEIDYFAGVTGSGQNTGLAYRYLVDHTAWFAAPLGADLLNRLAGLLGG
jgi:Ser/Thr protein kinase RdoA (MazF antagonist)